MKMIKSRIYEKELQKRKEDENLKNKEKKILVGEIRLDLMFYPYKLIKDLRSGYETSNVNDILDGKINDFLENSLTL